jgi:GNAT superfamily N-acetyltransferase
VRLRTYQGFGADGRALIEIFNAALSPTFVIDERLWLQNLDEDPHFDASGIVVAEDQGKPVGFVAARVCRTALGRDGLKVGQGWISCIAVAPQAQRRQVGSRLLAAAHTWLAQHRVTQVLTGGDPGHLFPGIPEGCAAAQAFFASEGYVPRGDVAHDVRRSLEGYEVPKAAERALARQTAFRVHPCTSAHVPGLLQFLERTFPGRWLYETRLRLEQERSPQDIMLLTIGTRVAGFAHTFQHRSNRLGPSVYWRHELGPDYGGLGPMGIAEDVRGSGLGLALLALSVERLHTDGVRDMAIDWTVLLDFYGACGFTSWRRYSPYACTLPR